MITSFLAAFSRRSRPAYCIRVPRQEIGKARNRVSNCSSSNPSPGNGSVDRREAGQAAVRPHPAHRLPTRRQAGHWLASPSWTTTTDKGWPVCPFIYTFTANGFDPSRQRHKWFCGQTCLRPTPLASLQPRLTPLAPVYSPSFEIPVLYWVLNMTGPDGRVRSPWLTFQQLRDARMAISTSKVSDN
jgi:hypothetical protein